MAAPNAEKPEPIRKLSDPVPSIEDSPARVSPRDAHNAWRNGPPPLPPALSSGPDIPGILRAFKRRWMAALSLGIMAAVVAAVAVYFLLLPKYTAFSQVYISYTKEVLLGNSREGNREANTYRRTQAARMKSRTVLAAALKRDEVKNLDVVRAQSDPIIWLEDELKVETPEESEYTTISMSGTDPDALIAIVNAVTQSYLREVNDEEPRIRGQRLAELESIMTKAGEKLKQKNDNFEQAAKLLGSSLPEVLSKKQEGMRGKAAEYARQHAIAQGELRRAEAKLRAHQAQQVFNTDPAVTESLVNDAIESDPIGKNILLRISRIQNFLEIEGAKYKDKNATTLVDARTNLARLENALQERKVVVQKEVARRLKQRAELEYKAGIAQLQNEVNLAAENEKIVAADLKKETAEADKVGSSSTELEMLRADIDRENELIKQVGKERGLLEVELRAPLRVRGSQDAGLQKKDIKRWLMGMIGAPIAAFMLCCVGVAFVEFNARRIQTTDEVVTGLGMRVVGSVPAMSGATGSDVIEHNLIESIDSIRTQLLRDASVEPTRVVMVTSAVSGEGKTTLASHLATSLARAGRKTLFIDCDLRRPSAHQLFDLPATPGFSEVLMNEVHAVEATRSTPVDGLWLMPAGQWDREVIQALARDGVHEIFDKLRGEYDFIVVDSHPVLPATDSLLIAQHVDAVLLSLLRDVSRMPRVHAACQRLGTLGIRVLGAVVNGTRPEDYGGSYEYAAPARAA